MTEITLPLHWYVAEEGTVHVSYVRDYADQYARLAMAPLQERIRELDGAWRIEQEARNVFYQKWSKAEAELSALRAQQSNFPVSETRDGWVLVPKEPTRLMNEAAEREYHKGNSTVAQIYHAMLAAAPVVDGKAQEVVTHTTGMRCRHCGLPAPSFSAPMANWNAQSAAMRCSCGSAEFWGTMTIGSAATAVPEIAKEPVAWVYPRRYGSGVSFAKPERCTNPDDGMPVEPQPLYSAATLAQMQAELSAAKELLRVASDYLIDSDVREEWEHANACRAFLQEKP